MDLFLGFCLISLDIFSSTFLGIIFTFSCSQVVDKFLFTNTIIAAAIEAGRSVRILEQLHQPADHPINAFHPEGEYLKGLVLQVD